MRISDWSSDVCSSDLRLWPGNQAVLADHPVDERRLAGVGPPDDRELERAERLFFVALCLCLTCFHERLDDRAERVEKIDQPFAMFGAERDRIVDDERIGPHQPRPPHLAPSPVYHQ